MQLRYRLVMALALSSGFASGQDLLREWRGDAPGDRYGLLTAGLGDLDQDGHADVAVGGWTILDPFVFHSYLDIRSGATGTVLCRLAAGVDHIQGPVANAGDVNGDGVPDFLVADTAAFTGETSVGLYSGKTCTPLDFKKEYDPNDPGQRWGEVLAGGADLNLDGFGEYLIGAPGFTSFVSTEGHFGIYDGKTGQKIFRDSDGNNSDGLATSAVFLPDIDGDGTADFAAGAPQPTVFFGLPGYVKVYSGKTLAPLRIIHGPVLNAEFGAQLLATEDQDGDSVPDLLVSASLGAGSVYVCSAASGAVLDEIKGPVGGEEFGGKLAAAHDVNGDGADDFLVGGTLSVHLYSGRDLDRLYVFKTFPGNPNYEPKSADGAGDVDGDGRPDLCMGVPGDGEGKGLVLSGNDLFLGARPNAVKPLEPFDLKTAGGTPGRPVVFFVEAIDDRVWFIRFSPVLTLDQRGSMTLPLYGPPQAPPGIRLVLRSFSLDPRGGIIDSARETVLTR